MRRSTSVHRPSAGGVRLPSAIGDAAQFPFRVGDRDVGGDAPDLADGQEVLRAAELALLEEIGAILADHLRRGLDEAVRVRHVASVGPEPGEPQGILILPGQIEPGPELPDVPLVALQAFAMARPVAAASRSRVARPSAPGRSIQARQGGAAQILDLGPDRTDRRLHDDAALVACRERRIAPGARRRICATAAYGLRVSWNGLVADGL